MSNTLNPLPRGIEITPENQDLKNPYYFYLILMDTPSVNGEYYKMPFTSDSPGLIEFDYEGDFDNDAPAFNTRPMHPPPSSISLYDNLSLKVKVKDRKGQTAEGTFSKSLSLPVIPNDASDTPIGNFILRTQLYENLSKPIVDGIGGQYFLTVMVNVPNKYAQYMPVKPDLDDPTKFIASPKFTDDGSDGLPALGICKFNWNAKTNPERKFTVEIEGMPETNTPVNIDQIMSL